MNSIENNMNREQQEINIKKLVNSHTYFPLYDVEKNSYIKRYQMWAKYRDYCISQNRKYVDVKRFAKIIEMVSKEVSKNLFIDSRGVDIFGTKLSLQFFRGSKLKNKVNKIYNVFIKIDDVKKKKLFRYSDWFLTAPEHVLKKVKEEDIDVNKFNIATKNLRNDINYFDMFNDF